MPMSKVSYLADNQDIMSFYTDRIYPFPDRIAVFFIMFWINRLYLPYICIDKSKELKKKNNEYRRGEKLCTESF